MAEEEMLMKGNILHVRLPKEIPVFQTDVNWLATEERKLQIHEIALRQAIQGLTQSQVHREAHEQMECVM